MAWVTITDIKNKLGILDSLQDDDISFVISNLNDLLLQKFNFDITKLGLTNVSKTYDSVNPNFAIRKSQLYTQPQKAINAVEYSTDLINWYPAQFSVFFHQYSGFIHRIVLANDRLILDNGGYIKVTSDYADFSATAEIINSYSRVYELFKNDLANVSSGSIKSESDHTTSVSYDSSKTEMYKDLFTDGKERSMFFNTFNKYNFSNQSSF